MSGHVVSGTWEDHVRGCIGVGLHLITGTPLCVYVNVHAVCTRHEELTWVVQIRKYVNI